MAFCSLVCSGRTYGYGSMGARARHLPGRDPGTQKNIDVLFVFDRTTITRDIVTKFKVENEDLLVMIGNFLMDNVGNQTSIRNVAAKLTSGTYKTNDKTAGAYIRYFCQAFLFYPIQRYDIKGKRYLESDKKYYLADLSFRFAELGSKRPDYGHLYEC